MLPEKLVFVDLETTGASNSYDRILEIGIIRVENNVITRTFHSLINPDTYIPPQIEQLTGISPKDVEHAPVFSQVRDEVMDILEGCTFVAHNVRFDYGFLRNECKRAGTEFSAKHFCTVKLSQYLFPQFKRHNLDIIIERMGIACTSRHRALDDAKVIAEFYQMIQKLFPAEIVLDAVNKAMKKPSIPLFLKKHDLDSLPELPGVYIFYGENEIPLYIGKSVNIKERVLSHFSSDIHNSTEMKISQQIKRIETIITAGELGALLLESRLIKKMLPLYNRQLRLKQQLIGLMLTKNQEGYDTISTKTISSVSPEDLHVFSGDGKILGFFRSLKQAKSYLSELAKEHALCEKMLSLEKTTAGCFAYRLGKCKGACVGKETPLFYNMRLLHGISDIKIKTWPFAEAIIIEEKNEIVGKSDYFILDKWCYLGNGTYDGEITQVKTQELLEFDLDVYKIIRRYLAAPRNLKNIKTIPRERLTQGM